MNGSKDVRVDYEMTFKQSVNIKKIHGKTDRACEQKKNRMLNTFIMCIHTQSATG
jgi:hypothetical protein